MRDPDLVFRAQLAASALEGAWHRWRVVHGLAADPMPTVSSYVGYSLEEPWGQPRVVFGLAAEDAEQLATLLERHDCVGPVYAAVAASPGARDLTGRRGARVTPLPVPRQAPPAAAQQPPGLDQADGDEFDEPLFRQAAAAIQEAAAARQKADQDGKPNGAAEGSRSPAPPAGQPAADGDQPGAAPGSLAQAASAARAVAEARIRAAITEYRSSLALQNPYQEVDLVLDDPFAAGLAMPEIHATDVLEPLPRPEVASGARASGPDETDQLAGNGVDELAESLTDPDAAEGSAPGVARRSRAARGYPIPRLSRTKRAGPVPAPDSTS